MNLERLIGNTPLVHVEKINPNPNVKIYCKLEGQNPGIQNRLPEYRERAHEYSGSS